MYHHLLNVSIIETVSETILSETMLKPGLSHHVQRWLFRVKSYPTKNRNPGDFKSHEISVKMPFPIPENRWDFAFEIFCVKEPLSAEIGIRE